MSKRWWLDRRDALIDAALARSVIPLLLVVLILVVVVSPYVVAALSGVLVVGLRSATAYKKNPKWSVRPV